MVKVKHIQGDLSLEDFLHSKGYNNFNMNRLTYKEIKQLIDGDMIARGKG